MPEPEAAAESQMAEDKEATNLSRTFMYLSATQFFSRGVPFIFNLWIMRHLTEEDYAERGIIFALSQSAYGACLFLVGYWVYFLSFSAFKWLDFFLSGTSEAFLHAVANESQLKKSNDSLLLFSLIYVMLNFLLIRSCGVVGLIFANSINMILRITYSAIFIKRYFKNSSFSFSSCLPSGWTFLLFSGLFTLILERLFLDQQKFWSTFLLHFSIGLVCFFVSLFVIHDFLSIIERLVIRNSTD